MNVRADVSARVHGCLSAMGFTYVCMCACACVCVYIPSSDMTLLVTAGLCVHVCGTACVVFFPINAPGMGRFQLLNFGFWGYWLWFGLGFGFEMW